MTSNDAIGVTEAAQQSAFAGATSLTGSARTPPPQTRRGERETATLWRSRRTRRLGAFARAPFSLEPRGGLAVHQGSEGLGRGPSASLSRVAPRDCHRR